MKTASIPALVLAGGVVNIAAGLLNMLVGFVYLFVCYGIVVIPIGLWQVCVGALACTQKRVVTNFTAACFGMFGSLITFNIMGFMLCLIAAGLLGFEMMQPIEDED